MEMRAQTGFRSALTPLSPGDRVCVSEREDFVEFLVHPDDAFRYLVHGFTRDGVVHEVRLVDAAPMMNALHIVVKNAPHVPVSERYGGNRE